MNTMIENADGVVAALSMFLLARIAEDDTEARRSLSLYGPGSSLYVAGNNPARVLAECAAKRAIIEDDYWERNDGYVGIEVVEDVFRRLALPYADHPDYRDEWKPWT